MTPDELRRRFRQARRVPPAAPIEPCTARFGDADAVAGSLTPEQRGFGVAFQSGSADGTVTFTPAPASPRGLW